MSADGGAVGLVARLTELGLTVAAAESLTAGALCARLADVPGASTVLRGGVVSYTDEVKIRLLDVDADLLRDRGAVDPEVAVQMACGALVAAGADVGVSTTGAAGPEPHAGKPVGTVFVGAAVRVDALGRSGIDAPGGWSDRELLVDGGRLRVLCGELPLRLTGGRAAVRSDTVDRAVRMLSGLTDSVRRGSGPIQ